MCKFRNGTCVQVLRWFVFFRIENRVQTMLQKAYWDAFDESLTAKRPDPLQAVTIFNEIKQVHITHLGYVGIQMEFVTGKYMILKK